MLIMIFSGRLNSHEKELRAYETQRAESGVCEKQDMTGFIIEINK